MNGYWVCTVQKPTETSFYNFTKSFALEKKVKSFIINVSADTRYRLYVNEAFVCEGPCQGGKGVHYFETADAAKFLKMGENTIRINVLHVVGEVFMTEYREDRPAIWVKSALTYDDGEESELVSDGSWACTQNLNVNTHVCKDMHITMPPNETVLAEDGKKELEIMELYRPCLETNCVTIWGDVQKYQLAPRPIPLFTAGEEKQIDMVKTGKCFAEFDAGEYTTARVRVRVQAEKGAQVRIIYSECRAYKEHYLDEDGDAHTRTVKKMRDDADGEIFGAYDVIYANGEFKEHEFFWFRSFRYIRIESDSPVEAEIYAARYVYPFTDFADNEGKGSFASNNKYLNDMWKVSVNTVECCTHETFVDCPYYEQGQYSMDGLLESLFALRLSNDRSMPEKFIEDLARCQNPEGLVPAKAPCVFDQLIPSFALFWIMAVREYIRYTANVDFAKKYTGTIDKVLECFNSFVDERGLVGETHYWNFIDWVPEWSRNGSLNEGRETLTLYSMMYAASLSDAAEIAEKCGRSGLASEYLARKASLVDAINAHCYDAEKGMYTDVPGKHMFSRHTTIWAVLSGTVCDDAARELIERTFAYDDVSLTTFSMNYFTFRALEKAGIYEKYAPMVFDSWKKMLDLNCTTWCENPDSPRSECHGWSSTPMYEISAMVLGVYPIEDGFSNVRIAPSLVPDGFEAKGRVPIPSGYIDVSVSRNNGKFNVSVEASCKLQMEILLLGEKTKAYTHKYDISVDI